jgi:multiple sugar transport system substrate-binding protein
MLMLFAGIGVSAKELTFVTHASTSVEQLKIQALAEEWGAARGVTVTVLFVSWNNIPEKVAVMTAAGIPPDVIRVDGPPNIRALWYMGICEDLTPYVQRDVGANLTNIWLKNVYDIYNDNGVQYALVSDLSPTNLYVDADRFASAGLVLPPKQWNAPNWTWNDFVNAARKLTVDINGDGVNETFGVGSFNGWRQTGLWNARWMDENVNYTGKSPQLIEALEEMARLYLEYGVVGGTIANSGAGMQIMQSNYVNNALTLTAGGRNIYIAPMPIAEQRASQVGIIGYAIHKGSRQRELAWDFIRYMCIETESTLKYGEASNRLPSHRLAQRDYITRLAVEAPEMNVQSLADATYHLWIDPYFMAPNANEIEATVRSAWEQVRNGIVPARQVVEEIEPRIIDIVSRKSSD